jgi:GNAT superfamily N-acetyltransferase
MPDVSIRDARADERDALLALTLTAYAEYAAYMSEPHWQLYQFNIQATLEAVAPAAQLVASAGSVLLGTVLLYPAKSFMPLPGGRAAPHPVVRLLAVDPAGRGRGVGAALMAECVQRARAAGSPALELHTMEMMQAARRMYARMGFTRAPETDLEPAPGVVVQGYRLVL